MKELFTGFYKKNEDEIKEIWQKGILVFDTNVILHLYRYSDATRNAVLDLMGKFSSQIHLPYQAAFEYNKNRCEAIAEQEKAYQDFLEKILQIKKEVQYTNKASFLTSELNKELQAVFAKANTELEDRLQTYTEYFQEDPIYDRIAELFKNRISERFSDAKLNQIYAEAEQRFKIKVPPGYQDGKSKEGFDKYGDLLLWKQIIGLAKLHKKTIILITDQEKEDWWWKIKDGRTLGPRYELEKSIEPYS